MGDDGLRPPSSTRIVTFPTSLIVDGVNNFKKYSSKRNDSPWTIRMMNSIQSWTSGFFNLFRRRSSSFGSNYLQTLYRPEKWQLDNPYIVDRKNDIYTEPRLTTTETTTEKEENEIIDETNYWRKMKNFSTSSNSKNKTYHWRSFPILSNQRSGVETGYWVPGAPGPLVWGDLTGKLEEAQKSYLKKYPTKHNITSRDP